MSEKIDEYLVQAKDELLALLLEEDEIQADQGESGTASPIPALSLAHLSATSFPLSFAQQRLWFFAQREPESAVYNVPCVLRMQGRLQIEAIVKSLQEICRRHVVLRATYTYKEREPQQIIVETIDLALPLTDMRASDWSQEERNQKALQIASEEVMQPFDLEKGPLLRGRLLRL
jgi:hypothetical protein